MKTKLAVAVLGATLTLSACDRHPDVVVTSQAQPQAQPAYAQQPNTVVVERDHSGDVATGIMTGMVMGHLLSGGSHYYSQPVQHTTIVNNHYVNKNNYSNTSVQSYSKPSTPSYAPSKKGWFSSRSSVKVNSSYSAKRSYKSPFSH